MLQDANSVLAKLDVEKLTYSHHYKYSPRDFAGVRRSMPCYRNCIAAHVTEHDVMHEKHTRLFCGLSYTSINMKNGFKIVPHRHEVCVFF